MLARVPGEVDPWDGRVEQRPGSGPHALCVRDESQNAAVVGRIGGDVQEADPRRGANGLGDSGHDFRIAPFGNVRDALDHGSHSGFSLAAQFIISGIVNPTNTGTEESPRGDSEGNL